MVPIAWLERPPVFAKRYAMLEGIEEKLMRLKEQKNSIGHNF